MHTTVVAEHQLSALCTLHLLDTPFGLRLNVIQTGRSKQIPPQALPGLDTTHRDVTEQFRAACQHPKTERRILRYLKLMEEEE